MSARQQYYVAMTIDGVQVPSSAVANGTWIRMEAVVKRLMRNKARHVSVAWEVVPCM